MGTMEGDFDPDHRVTHGICAACGCALLRAGEEVPAQEFLDGLTGAARREAVAGLRLLATDGAGDLLASLAGLPASERRARVPGR